MVLLCVHCVLYLGMPCVISSITHAITDTTNRQPFSFALTLKVFIINFFQEESRFPIDFIKKRLRVFLECLLVKGKEVFIEVRIKL